MSRSIGAASKSGPRTSTVHPRFSSKARTPARSKRPGTEKLSISTCRMRPRSSLTRPAVRRSPAARLARRIVPASPFSNAISNAARPATPGGFHHSSGVNASSASVVSSVPSTRSVLSDETSYTASTESGPLTRGASETPKRILSGSVSRVRMVYRRRISAVPVKSCCQPTAAEIPESRASPSIFIPSVSSAKRSAPAVRSCPRNTPSAAARSRVPEALSAVSSSASASMSGKLPLTLVASVPRTCRGTRPTLDA